MSRIPVRVYGCALTLVLTVSMAACGFQMRGAAGVPPEMQRTYIQTTDRHSIFYRKLHSALINAGVDVVETPADADATLSILTDVTDQRVLSVSARNVPREYEVFYTITFALDSGDSTIIEPSTQTRTRAYTWDETRVLGKSQEEQLLRDAIADDLVRIVLIQLAAI